jgi:hypothetical protein
MRGGRPRRSDPSLISVAMVLVVALIAGACGASTPSDRPGDGVVGPTPQVDEQQMDCERDGYPCSWSEADPAATVRTDQLLALSSLLLTQGANAEEIAGRLRVAAGVAEVAFDKITVWFRVDGAPPVFVYVDPTDGGLIEGAVPPLEAGAAGSRVPIPDLLQPGHRFTGCSWGGEDDRTDGQKGPVGRTGTPKKALILGPWKWQMDWDVETLVSNLKLGESDYEIEGGGVTIVMTEQDRPSAFLSTDEPAVRLEDFCGWEQYDTIILKTHGRTVCAEARCLTGLSVGRFAETKEALLEYAGGATGVTFSTSSYGNLQPSSYLWSDAYRDECIRRLEAGESAAADDCLERLPDAGHMEVTSDFFRANYAGGLKDRLIFLSACQGMKEGNLARALRGSGESTGAILGFDRIIQTSVANKVLERFADWVGTGRAINQDALRELNRLADDTRATVPVAAQILGVFTAEEMADVVPDGSEVTRGADIVSLHEQPGGPELVDGGTVRAQGRPGDSADEVLLLGARLTGVGEEGPEAYEIQIRLDDERLLLREFEWVGTDREGVFDAEVEAIVGRDLAPDEPIDLEIRTELPDTDGALSLWRYEDLDVGPRASAVITVGGQTWEFEMSEPIGGCLVGRTGILAAGAVEGDPEGVTFSASLVADGGSITVDDDISDQNWTAIADRAHITLLHLVPMGHSQIDTITIQDGRAWGTATFVDTGEVYRWARANGPPPVPVAGSFDIRCGG